MRLAGPSIVIGSMGPRRYTNRLRRSEDFGATSHWAPFQSASITSAAGFTAASGPKNPADKLIEDANDVIHGISQALVDDGTSAARALSVYAKAGTRSWLGLLVSYGAGGSKTLAAWFNLGAGTAGTVFSTDGTPTSGISAIGSGVYRCYVSLDAMALPATALIFAATGDVGTNYPGVAAASAIEITGAAFENAGTPSAYYRT